MTLPLLPDNPSPQFLRLYQNYITLVNFFTLFSMVDAEIPHIIKRLGEEDPTTEQAFTRYLSSIRYQEIERYKFSHLIAEIHLSRTIDQFHVYVVDMLRAYFRQHPEELLPKVRRGKPRKVAGVGQAAPDDVDYYAMIQADKQLQDGFTKIMEFLSTKINLKMRFTQELIKEVDGAINIRNIIIHNRGRVNERFLNRINNDALSADTPLIFDQNQANYYTSNVLTAASFIDSAFIDKYGIEIFTKFTPFPTLTEGVNFANARLMSISLEEGQSPVQGPSQHREDGTERP